MFNGWSDLWDETVELYLIWILDYGRFLMRNRNFVKYLMLIRQKWLIDRIGDFCLVDFCILTRGLETLFLIHENSKIYNFLWFSQIFCKILTIFVSHELCHLQPVKINDFLQTYKTTFKPLLTNPIILTEFTFWRGRNCQYLKKFNSQFLTEFSNLKSVKNLKLAKEKSPSRWQLITFGFWLADFQFLTDFKFKIRWETGCENLKIHPSKKTISRRSQKCANYPFNKHVL